MRLILGSASPRRREILEFFSLNFDQISPNFDEDAISFLDHPENYVKAIAEGKALSLKEMYPEAAILTADTTVYKDGKIYGKPKNEQEAFQFLSELQGNWHTVYTGAALAFDGKVSFDYAETKVLFTKMNEVQIKNYLNALHWADKAGGYANQLAGSLIVEKIDGCYYNAMGLSIQVLRKLLLEIGIDLWNHLR